MYIYLYAFTYLCVYIYMYISVHTYTHIHGASVSGITQGFRNTSVSLLRGPCAGTQFSNRRDSSQILKKTAWAPDLWTEDLAVSSNWVSLWCVCVHRARTVLSGVYIRTPDF